MGERERISSAGVEEQDESYGSKYDSREQDEVSIVSKLDGIVVAIEKTEEKGNFRDTGWLCECGIETSSVIMYSVASIVGLFEGETFL